MLSTSLAAALERRQTSIQPPADEEAKPFVGRRQRSTVR